ncbi:hypothetical protein ACSL103130_00130 [Actinomyces slackii]|uniref:Uncharacterized protein n=1 Tax=Actinomyces slackii TaxID=52774 RepID=A0A448KF68_9ACTO|nr:hypothetical protein [Actinomyces slackii]VEG75555.1 Uncharacterised protein [Actinomyces slackii]
MDDAINDLLREAARAERMESLRGAIHSMTQEQRASYEAESREWLNLPTYYVEG